MQCGSLTQVSADRGEHTVEMKSSHNVQEWPAKHQTINGFNAVPGTILTVCSSHFVHLSVQSC
jgi:hypothetical protein